MTFSRLGVTNRGTARTLLKSKAIAGTTESCDGPSLASVWSSDRSWRLPEVTGVISKGRKRQPKEEEKKEPYSDSNPLEFALAVERHS